MCSFSVHLGYFLTFPHLYADVVFVSQAPSLLCLGPGHFSVHLTRSPSLTPSLPPRDLARLNFPRSTCTDCVRKEPNSPFRIPLESSCLTHRVNTPSVNSARRGAVNNSVENTARIFQILCFLRRKFEFFDEEGWRHNVGCRCPVASVCLPLTGTGSMQYMTKMTNMWYHTIMSP